MNLGPRILLALLLACAAQTQGQDVPSNVPENPFDTDPFDGIPSGPPVAPRPEPRRRPVPRIAPTPPPDPAPAPSAPPAAVIPAPPKVPAKASWQRLEVVQGWYTHNKVALLQPECTRLADHAALLAAQDLTSGVIAGKAEAIARGRKLLALALHLDPQHAISRRINDSWADGKAPSLRPPGDEPVLVASFALSAADRVRQPGTPEGEALARCLTEFAADLDPRNEGAVYAAEVQLRDRKAPPWESMERGDPKPPAVAACGPVAPRSNGS